MGEIKSTLDLVMERTRHLSLSDDEKAGQQREDFKKRLQGLLLQYEDDALSLDGLQERIAELQSRLHISDPVILLRGLSDRLDPEGDNRRWLMLLRQLAPDLHDPLQQALAEYRGRRADLLQTCQKRLLEQLAQRHGIKGSAVVPLAERDARCREDLAALRSGTQERIHRLVQQA